MLVVAVTLPAGARPSHPTTTTTTSPPLDNQVFVLGDSVMLGAEGSVAFRLGLAGWHVTQYSAESLHTYNAAGIIDQARASGQVGEVVVVALGNNDGVSRGQFAGWIDGLVGHLRDVRRVYWVNLRRFKDWVPAANADIADAARRWPNIRVIDWDARATPDPSLVVADGLHLTTAGQAAMAELVGTTLEQYRAERTRPTATTTTKVPTKKRRGSRRHKHPGHKPTGWL